MALILEAALILALTTAAWNERLAFTRGSLRQPESPVVLKSRANARIQGKKGRKKKYFSPLHPSLLIPADWAHLTLRQRDCKSQTRPVVPTSVCTPLPAAPASVHPSILLPSTSSKTFPPNAHIAEITVESNEGQKKFPPAPTTYIFFFFQIAKK